MPIFRYTFKKILVSPSTWVVLGLTWIILGLSWCLFPALIANSDPNFSWTSELVKLTYLPFWKQLAFYSLIGMMLLIFIGIKSVQIFRDEIDDGTLLILVSKPISRNRIWLEKWLTFQAVVIGYIFLSILLPAIILLIPSIGGTTLFVTMIPYFFILFGIGLIFDLIFTSIVLLISLVLNSKATIAIMVVLAALTNIFASVIDQQIIVIPTDYFIVSQATTVFNQLEHKLSSDDLSWFNDERAKDVNSYKSEIDIIMKKIYTTTIGKSPTFYPNKYDPIAEQNAIKTLAKATSLPAGYTNDEWTLIKHIAAVSNIFRQWKEQSYEEIMTGVGVGIAGNENGDLKHVNRNRFNAKPGDNTVFYSVEDVFKALNTKFTSDQIKDMNNKVTQKRILRYFNIFYQLYYLFNGIINENISIYSTPLQFQQTDDPYLVSFDNNTKQVMPDSGKNKILNFPALMSVYLLVGFSLLGASWYIFNRRDFA